MIKLLSSLFLLLFAGAVTAQQPRHYNFTHYTVESGLISYQLNCAAQDKEGYIWIATNNGLQRYDGIRYKDFRHTDNDPASIPSKGIKQILFDKAGNMWLMATDGVTGLFDRNNFTFKNVPVKIRNTHWLQSPQLLKQLITDEQGHVFLLLPGKELVTYSKEKNEFSGTYNFFGGKKEWLIYDLVQQPGTTKYWLCIKGQAILIYDLAKRMMNENSAVEKMVLGKCSKILQPHKIFFDRQNRVWVAVTDSITPYIYCYDLNTGETLLENYDFNKQAKKFYEVPDFMQQQDGTIWVTGTNIMARFLEKEKQFEQVYNGYADDRSIDFISISHMMEDREHNLWAGTGNNGLFRFNPSEEFFTSISHNAPGKTEKSNASPIGFMDDADGSFLVGYWEERLVRYNKNLEEIPLGIKGFAGNTAPAVPEMCNSADDKFIWMALQKQGLCRYDKSTRTVAYYSSPLFKSRIRTMTEDRQGNLWIGTQEDGVFKWDAARGKNIFADGIEKATAITATRINKIIIDKKGFVWVGTFAEGVYRIDPATGKAVLHFYQNAPEPAYKLPEQTVSALLELNDSLMMIATHTSLLAFNTNSKKLSTVGSSRSISGFTSTMEKDRNGFVWLGTTTALYRVNVPQQLFVKYNRLDGIRNDYFLLSASHVLPDGRMLLGSTATMVVFDPAAIKSRVSFPEIHITDFKVMNRSLPLDSLLKQKEITLAAGENSISIALSTLSYSNPYVIKYKLEGLEKDWKTADKTQEIVYPYLPPGKYRLLVNVTNEDGKVMEKRLELALRIHPPFWKAWWFYSLAALFVTGLVFYLDRERMKRKKLVQDMRSSIASNLHQEVNTALSNINVLSEMAKLKAGKDPEKSKEFIEQIHDKSGRMIYAMEDMLWAIAPENDSMDKAVERMQEYIEGLNSRHRSNITMVVDDRVRALGINMQVRHEILMLFKETIQGMIKACDGNCTVHAGLYKNNLVYTMAFNSRGCDTGHLNSILQSAQLQKRLNNSKGVVNTKVLAEKTIVEFTISL